jgi:hypothetical protein
VSTSFPNSVIFDAAPSLEALKKLPVETKSRLLLARLARIGAHDTNALNKAHLMLPGDSYQLAYSYSAVENNAVRQHLLGAPWTRLVNEGYIADYGGQGFFSVTDEGKEFLRAEPPSAVVASPAPKPAQTRVPARTPGVPRALLSYSWDGEEHNRWVLDLAGRLQGESGIQILLDQWYLQAGDDRLHFMEQGVSSSDFVIVVCTATYAERANRRQGGVGYESMVITGELAQHMLTNKFIPVLRTGSWSTSLPAYLQSRLGVDLSGDPYSSAQYEQLLRVLHGEPIRPPRIGPKPVFDIKRSAAPIPPPPSGAVPPASNGSGSVLGPANKRPNAIVHARYEKKGVNVPHESAFIRFWDRDGGRYSFENSRGEEHLGTKREVFDRFQRFQTDLIEAGYTRMQFGSNSDPLFSSL